MSKRITASQLLETFKTKEVEIPELDGTVLVRELSAAQRFKLSTQAMQDQDMEAVDTDEFNSAAVLNQLGELYPIIVAMGLVEPRLTVDQVRAIPGHLTDAFTTIAEEIMELSGLFATEEAQDDPKA
jgi:hypothetical protein